MGKKLDMIHELQDDLEVAYRRIEALERAFGLQVATEHAADQVRSPSVPPIGGWQRGGDTVRDDDRRCKKHSPLDWVESVPVGRGYCHACVLEKYNAAPACPHCGEKMGFSMGTGDCDCQDSDE